MAATNFGTVHLYGVVSGTVDDATVQNFTPKSSLANRSQVENEVGNVINRRQDDLTVEASIELKIQAGFAAPVPGTTFTYNAVLYEVVSVDKKEANKEHVIYTLTIMNSEYVDLAP